MMNSRSSFLVWVDLGVLLLLVYKLKSAFGSYENHLGKQEKNEISKSNHLVLS